ncbi:MAG: hypothetical protein C4297_13295 [Gemmataceae bacterium]
MLAPVLEREEYVEQAYFFRVLRERLRDQFPAQEILTHIHEEILTTTKLPYAIQYLATEIKHSGVLAPGFERLSHYFTPFQAFVVRKSEEEGLRFSFDMALAILEAEARYRSESPTPAGLFLFEFEVLCRHRLGYDEGLLRIQRDGFFDEAWRQFMETVRRSIGEIEFSDLIYLYSELYAKEHPSESERVMIVFGEKEGKIAKASHGRDPLYFFAAIQRQLGYPAVPRPPSKDDLTVQVGTLKAKVRELEQRIRLLDAELRGQVDIIQNLGRPETKMPGSTQAPSIQWPED